MSWGNVLQRTGSGFCPADTYTHFGFMIFTQEQISTYVDPRPYSTVGCSSDAVVSVPCNC